MSGIVTLDIADDTGETVSVYGDNGPTVRALAASFPGLIQSGHCIDASVLVDREVFWWYDDLGLCLGGIAPVNEETENALALMIEDGEISQ
jgi:hypothetical protein